MHVSMEKSNSSGTLLTLARVFSFRPEYLEMDPESYDGTSAEVVEKKGRSFEVHQILRIRAEDLHLRKDHVGEGNLRLKDTTAGVVHFMLFSRPILPASPLSRKTDTKR